MRSAAVLLQCHSRLITYLSSSICDPPNPCPAAGPLVLSLFFLVFFSSLSLISSCIFVVIKTTSPLPESAFQEPRERMSRPIS